ncbi:insulinase family protein [Haliea sp. E1-2-M8]|uniref:insulinase family protein n=1 Tax=Haliea sp. E1-2-M8 TaxID=3064706 RepID=UPI0027156934|nr:insulinase family protein [Haliea sp. E1-2-M8]MDO8863445.1 insulinase family protein [Haliea sp. E1-2-M8]
MRPLCVSRHLYSLLALCVLLLAGCQRGEPPAMPEIVQPVAEEKVITSPSDSREYGSFTMGNQLEVLLVSDPGAQTSSAAVSVGVGMLQDPMEYQGMAHYLEHMLLLASEDYPEPDGFMSFISQHGGTHNAYTWLDLTNYMFEIPNAHYTEALHRFSAVFRNPLLDPDYIEKEKNAVHAEWSMRRARDFDGIFELDRAMLGEHPANRFLVGNLDTLADKPGSSLHDATVDFYQRYYSANIMKLVMLSPMPLAEMRIMARTYFGAVENKEITKPEVDAGLDLAGIGGQRVHYRPQEDLRQLSLEFLISNNRDQFRSKPNQYLAYILGSEMPGTPAATFKERGWASDFTVTVQPDLYGNYGAFSIGVEVTSEGMAHRETMVTLILGYIEQLRAAGVSDRYAREFKTSLDNAFEFLQRERGFDYVANLAEAMQHYPVLHAVDANYRFEGFDKAAVDAVLGQLTPAALRVWYISQQEPTEVELEFFTGRYQIRPLELPSADEQRAAAEQAGLALPALNTLLPEKFALHAAATEPTRVVDSDGIELWLQGSEHFAEQPRGYTQLYFNTPARQESATGSVLLALWADLYQQRQKAWFTEAAIAGMNAKVSVDDGIRLSVTGFTDKQLPFLQQALAGLQFKPGAQDLEQARDRFLRQLDNDRRSIAIEQLFSALRRVAYSGRYDDSTLRDAAAAVTLEQLQAFISDTLAHNHIRGYLFGNYDADHAKALVETLSSQFPERSARAYTRSDLYAPTRGQSVVLAEDTAVEDLGMLHLYLAPEAGFAGIAAARVLGAHLGDRAFVQLRTEEQLGYAAGGLGNALGDFGFVGLYIQTPVKNAADMFARLQRFTAEYADSLSKLDLQEFTPLRDGVLNELRQPPQNLAEEAAPFLQDWDRERYDFDSRARLIAAVEDTALADIQNFYRDSVLAEDRSSLLLQLRGTRFADAPFAVIPGVEPITGLAEFHARMALQKRDASD